MAAKRRKSTRRKPNPGTPPKKPTKTKRVPSWDEVWAAADKASEAYVRDGGKLVPASELVDDGR